jgi:glyoxylase-like metal-dependent hydrolase (beta-lactamase superfamily II)
VGWNTRLVDGVWKPTFPNAKYLMSKTEFNHADATYRSGKKDTHTQAFEDSIDPILRAKQAVLVADDYEVDKGMWIEACHGHTPGNIVINIESEGQRGVLTGDVIHHQIQLRYPEMSTTADDNQDLARVSRTALIEKHAGSGNLIFPAHFPAPTIGRIEPNAAGGFRYDTDAV